MRYNYCPCAHYLSIISSNIFYTFCRICACYCLPSYLCFACCERRAQMSWTQEDDSRRIKNRQGFGVVDSATIRHYNHSAISKVHYMPFCSRHPENDCAHQDNLHKEKREKKKSQAKPESHTELKKKRETTMTSYHMDTRTSTFTWSNHTDYLQNMWIYLRAKRFFFLRLLLNLFYFFGA